MRKRIKYIIGIDEVGRGALAGPVVVAAVAATTKFRIQNSELRMDKKSKNYKFFPPKADLRRRRMRLWSTPSAEILNSKLAPLRDSKKLSPRQREVWFRYIKNISVNQRSSQRKSAICYAVARVSPKVIDRINISKAANLAATRATIKLIGKLQDCKIERLRNKSNGKRKFLNHSIFQSFNVHLDGGLYLNKISVNQRNQHLSAATIVRGDEKIPVIMLASIVAKVTRDRYMKKLPKKYLRYDFINNVGYGTKKHIKAIKRFGYSKIHRRSFHLK